MGRRPKNYQPTEEDKKQPPKKISNIDKIHKSNLKEIAKVIKKFPKLKNKEEELILLFNDNSQGEKLDIIKTDIEDPKGRIYYVDGNGRTITGDLREVIEITEYYPGLIGKEKNLLILFDDDYKNIQDSKVFAILEELNKKEIVLIKTNIKYNGTDKVLYKDDNGNLYTDKFICKGFIKNDNIYFFNDDSMIKILDECQLELEECKRQTNAYYNVRKLTL
jgi:hypothetical protein